MKDKIFKVAVIHECGWCGGYGFEPDDPLAICRVCKGEGIIFSSYLATCERKDEENSEDVENSEGAY